MTPTLFLQQLLLDKQYDRLFNLVTDITVKASNGNIIYITDYTIDISDNTSQLIWLGYGLYSDLGEVYATSYNELDKDIEVMEILRFTRNRYPKWIGYFKDVIQWLWLTKNISEYIEPKAFRLYHGSVVALESGEHATVYPIDVYRYLLPYYYGIRYTGFIAGNSKRLYWNKYGRCVSIDYMRNRDVLPYLDYNEDYTSLRYRFDYYGDGYDIDEIL